MRQATVVSNPPSRFTAVRLEIEAIQLEAKNPTALSASQKSYLIERCLSLAGEIGEMALTKMQRGDRV
jgi:hypothetical protein